MCITQNRRPQKESRRVREGGSKERTHRRSILIIHDDDQGHSEACAYRLCVFENTLLR